MSLSTLFLFAITVLPLVLIPGPDVLFIVAQGMTSGRAAAFKANAGVLMGYIGHGIMAAFGIAALVASQPALFEVMRWVGVAYLIYLAFGMIRSSFRAGSKPQVATVTSGRLLVKGFLTSFLNPKGLMVYFVLLPPFIDASGSIALQASLLSVVNVCLCCIVYSVFAYGAGTIGGSKSISDQKRRVIEFCGGALVGSAAVKLAAS
jgi:threonine/homoserine/homoserine lactone efflux protein